MGELLSILNFDYIDLLLVEGLGRYGPRNIFKVSREINMPESSVRYRIKRLRDRGMLYMHANIYHTNIGLKKGVVFADVNPVYKHDIYRFIDANDYWIQINKIHGRREGVYVLYTVPTEHFPDLKHFLDELVRLDVFSDYELLESTCYHRVNPSTTWYDISSGRWMFDWGKLVEDVEKADTELPITLRDPLGFPILADALDILILKELEKDPTVSFKELGRKFDTSAQNIKYHYDKHIIRNFLLEDYTIYLKKYDPRISLKPYFIIDFPNGNTLAKVANAFMNKPFSEVLGKILREDKIILFSHIPVTEFPNMINTMDRLAEFGYIKKYRYYISLPSEKGLRETIPYKLFEHGHWAYSHNKHINRLYKIYNDAKQRNNN